MNFQFHVHLTDKDYVDFNIFWLTRSHYGKKQMLKYRLLIALFVSVIAFLSLWGGNFTADAFIGIIPYFILLALFQLLLKPFIVLTLKGSLKALKKHGKMGYSPDAEMEFSEDVFTETTPENKTEQKYFSIERISIMEDGLIYLHVSNVMAYILPVSCFASPAQYDAFLRFITAKCPHVDTYR